VKTWPRPLTSRPCESARGTCVHLVHAGRERRDACECCESFLLGQHDGPGAQGREQLRTVTIQYAAEQYADVLNAARLLTKAMGLPETEWPAGLNRPPSKRHVKLLTWEEATVKRQASLELQINRGKAWMLFLALTWYPEVNDEARVPQLNEP
jgi:hypothetical protein